MNLSHFIRNNMEAILNGWESFARELAPAPMVSRRSLRDHAAGILAAIASDLEQAQSPTQQAAKARGHGPPQAGVSAAEQHGAGRQAEGFNVCDAVAEFRALRASVLHLWVDSGQMTAGDIAGLTRFNEAIDQALAESLARFMADSQRNRRLFDALLSASPDVHAIIAPDGRLMYLNLAMAALLRRPLGELVDQNLYGLRPSFTGALRTVADAVLASGRGMRGEVACVLAAGLAATYEYTLAPVLSEDGMVEALAFSARDVSERKAAEERVRRCADYDSLTDLPNRSLFLDRLEHEIRRAARSGLGLALMFIDLDGFKEVNDRLGHDAGDQLLKLSAQRIRACVRGSDTVARLGGDEFTVILTEVRNLPHADILAGQILDGLARPFPLDSGEVRISASIGIALCPQDGQEAGELLRSADQAMYVAKNAGRSRFSFFTRALREAARARQTMMDELRGALERRQFLVYFQPVYALASGALAGAETQLRWRHPRQGVLAPARFIGLAEEIGMLAELDDWVLGQALACLQRWSALLGWPFELSLRLSALELQCQGAAARWAGQLAMLGQAGSGLKVEIPERLLLSEAADVRTRLTQLHDAGVGLGVTNFGAGCCPITALQKYGISFLNIAPEFTAAIGSDAGRRAAIRAMVALAHALGLSAVALGVEYAGQRDWLALAACDRGQGSLFAPAMPAEQFEQLLRGAPA